jgi:hypothetical protein
MHPDLQSLYHKAQDRYLQGLEIKLMRLHADHLGQRLAVYEILRDNEVNLFQPVADHLEQAFPKVETRVLSQSLQQWLTIMRYASMAMLVSNPEFLQHRLLEWLTDVVQAHNTMEISTKIHELLHEQLRKKLNAEQLDLLLPLLDQARMTLVGIPPLSVVVEA